MFCEREPLFSEAQGEKERWGRWMAPGTRLWYFTEWGLFWSGLYGFLCLFPLTANAWQNDGRAWLVWLSVAVASPFLYAVFGVIMDEARPYNPVEVYVDEINLQTTFSERRKGLDRHISRSEIESVRVLRRRAIHDRTVPSAHAQDALLSSNPPYELIITTVTGQVRRTGKRRPGTVRAVTDILTRWGVTVIDEDR